MVPALTRGGTRGYGSASRRVRVYSARRHHGPVDACGRGRQLRVHADPEAARAVSGFAGRGEQPTRAEVNSNHAVSSGCWLTGVPPKRTDGPDFQAGVSVDQVIAQRIGQDTTFPSLEVATEDFSGLVGACDPGYSCAYMNTLNWQTPTTPLPMEINPRVVFERLFGGGGTLEQRLARMRTDRSLLDFVADDLKHLEGGLPSRDRARLDEYLSYIREIERRIERAEQQAHAQPDVPNAPVGVPEAYVEHVALMFDLLALAFQADLTRVFTFMMAREVSQRTYPEIGVTEPHHSISHHGNRPAAIEGHARLNAYHVSMFAKFLERLRAMPDGDGSILDHSILVYGSGMSDGNGHTGCAAPARRRWRCERVRSREIGTS